MIFNATKGYIGNMQKMEKRLLQGLEASQKEKDKALKSLKKVLKFPIKSMNTNNILTNKYLMGSYYMKSNLRSPLRLTEVRLNKSLAGINNSKRIMS